MFAQNLLVLIAFYFFPKTFWIREMICIGAHVFNDLYRRENKIDKYSQILLDFHSMYVNNLDCLLILWIAEPYYIYFVYSFFLMMTYDYLEFLRLAAMQHLLRQELGVNKYAAMVGMMVLRRL